VPFSTKRCDLKFKSIGLSTRKRYGPSSTTLIIAQLVETETSGLMDFGSTPGYAPCSWWLFLFGLHTRWVHSVSEVVSDWQGVGGVLDVRISVQCTHSACQKQCSWTGSETVRIWPQIEQNTFCWQPDMEIPSFSQQTGLGPVCKTYR